MAAQTQSHDTQQVRPDQEGPREPQLRRSWSKLILLAAVLAVLLVIVYFSPLHQYLGDLRSLSQRVRSFGPMAPLVLAGSVAVLVAIGFPRLVFCFLAGMTLGFWSGLFWAQLGTLLGNYLLFLMFRGFLRDWGQRMLAKRTNFHMFVQQKGALGVALVRQLPLPGSLINIGCALLPIKHRDFLVGTVIGQLPQAIPCTLIGAGLLQPSLKRSIGVIGLAVAVSVAGWLSLRYALNRSADPTRRIPNS